VKEEAQVCEEAQRRSDEIAVSRSTLVAAIAGSTRPLSFPAAEEEEEKECCKVIRKEKEG
jgi:hypothetical protein